MAATRINPDAVNEATPILNTISVQMPDLCDPEWPKKTNRSFTCDTEIHYNPSRAPDLRLSAPKEGETTHVFHVCLTELASRSEFFRGILEAQLKPGLLEMGRGDNASPRESTVLFVLFLYLLHGVPENYCLGKCSLSSSQVLRLIQASNRHTAFGIYLQLSQIVVNSIFSNTCNPQNVIRILSEWDDYLYLGGVDGICVEPHLGAPKEVALLRAWKHLSVRTNDGLHFTRTTERMLLFHLTKQQITKKEVNRFKYP